MSLRMGEAMAALEFLHIRGEIKVKRRPFKPNNLTGNPALPTVVQVPYEAQAAELSCDHI
jgi:hypothetical protein